MGLLSWLGAPSHRPPSKADMEHANEFFAAASHLVRELNPLGQGMCRFDAWRGGEHDNRVFVGLVDPDCPGKLLDPRGRHGWQIAEFLFDVGIHAKFRHSESIDHNHIESFDFATNVLRKEMVDTLKEAQFAAAALGHS